MDLLVLQTVRGGVEDAICQALGKKVSMEKSASGAPYLEGDDHCVSLSHKDNRLVVALSTKPVGVDIEKLQDKPAYYRIADSYFAEKVEDGDMESFFRAWTKRESFGKLLGTGLTREVMAMDFSSDSIDYMGEKVYFVEHRSDDYLIMVASYYADATFEWKGGDYDKHD